MLPDCHLDVSVSSHLVEVESSSQVLSTDILRQGDLPGTLIARDDLLSPVCYFILAEWSAHTGMLSVNAHSECKLSCASEKE